MMKVTYIELLGQKHPMCFSMAAAEALGKRFGSLSVMREELGSGETPRVINAADGVLTELLKAGRIYCSAMGEELPPPITCRPADLIGASDKTVLSVILQALSADSKREVETDSGNAVATQEEA